MLAAADKDKTTLRFGVGDRVLCNCGPWKPGTIVKLWYTQPSFPPDKIAPYQVKLDEGNLIYVPSDEERLVRPYDGPADDDDEAPEESKLPVTIVTGFLGAGKTTLLNYILKTEHGKKIVVIENEFGAESIDEGLVKDHLREAEEIISMDNGCACCTVRGDLVSALTQLKERKAEFDLLIVETTGLADPAPIIGTFTQSATIQNHFRIDGVITMVDCKHVRQHLDEVRPEGTVNEAVQQVAFADRIIVNKTDLVTADEKRAVRETINAINAFAEVIEAQNSIVPIDKLMDMHAFSMERFEEDMKEYDLNDAHDHSHDAATCTDPTHEHGHAEHGHAEHGHAEHGHAEHGHAEHGHAEHGRHGEVMECEPAHAHEHAQKKKRVHDLSGVGSFCLYSEAPLNSQKFNAFMVRLLQAKRQDLYRSKGVLCFEGEGDSKFIFQGVHEQIQFEQSLKPWVEGQPRVSKVVFIGRSLPRDEIEEGFKGCAATI